VETVRYSYFQVIIFTDVLTYLLIYLLTPWSRFLLEKLAGSQLVKKFVVVVVIIIIIGSTAPGGPWPS
jgi:hypothetical protein